MAETVLVSTSLSDNMVKAGAQLIRRLDESNAQVSSSFWFYLSEERAWKLIIASQLVDDEGPRSFYKRIVDANKLAIDDEKTISLNDIGVYGPTNNIVQLLRFAIHTGDGISDVRFSRNTINGLFIEDAHIYRST
ncbi:hypothetical protein [Ferrimonas sp.]|uniref:hypothetical protein n=1 Tax=Ferrimonas sp. TaxID=2080861 RepID=UPI003A90F9A0